MRWIRAKFGGLVMYGLIAALVAGGLGWVTREAIQLEEDKWKERAESAHKLEIHLALAPRWPHRPFLTREEDRPTTTSARLRPLRWPCSTGKSYASGTVLETVAAGRRRVAPTG